MQEVHSISLKIFTFIMLIASSAYSQTVSNILAKVDGDKILITYDLDGEIDKDYQINLYYSSNDKDYINTPSLVSGNVSSKEKIGKQKQIWWDAKKELGNFAGQVRFKIGATSELTTIEKIVKEDDYFIIEPITHSPFGNGFKVTAKIKAKTRIKTSFSKNSYSVDEFNRILNLTEANVSGRDILNSTFDFLAGIEETIELVYLSKVSISKAESIKGFSLTYSKGTITLNFKSQ